MKFFSYLTAIVLVVFSSCEDENDSSILLRSMVTSDGYDETKRTFEYTSTGKIELFSDYSGNVKEYYKVFQYEGPLLIQATNYNVRTNSVVFSTAYLLSYFSNFEVKEAVFPDSPVPNTYSFTWTGHHITRVDIEWPTLTKNYFYTIAYDEQGNPTKIEYFTVDKYNDLKTTLISTREYEYDSKKNPLLETGYSIEFLIWLGSSSWREAYNTIGTNNITKETITSYGISGPEISTVENTYSYNGNNVPARRVQVRITTRGSEYKTETSYSYY